MCGRFVRTSPVPVIVNRFNIDKVLLPDIPPSYNIAPDKEVLIVTHEEKRQLLPCLWGFLPSWAKDMSVGGRMINARAETVSVKSVFRHALKKHRCLIVANGFFEWERKSGGKHPVYIKLKSGAPFGFAGITNLWESPDGNVIFTCAIITTEPNDLLKQIHHRMPVIVSPESEALWLDRTLEDKNILTSLLKPYPSVEMEMYAVSQRMNSPMHDRPENIYPCHFPV